MSNAAGHIFQIQRWSVHDGEGIRTVVFLKGCPLRCQWCANPESWQGKAEILFLREKCIHCGRCRQACAAGLFNAERGTGGKIPGKKCVGCGQCSAVCPAGACKKVGADATVDEVMKVIRRDAVFYRESGGGVTFSGGEPFLQAGFLRQLAAACKRLGIDTAVETSGYFEWEQAADIVADLDFIFVDIKHMDNEVHKKLTGAGNEKILANVARLAALQPTVVRVPLLAEVNDGEHNIRNMCEFLKGETMVRGVELLPYHNHGEEKLKALGAVARGFATPDAARLATVRNIITSYDIPVLDFK